MRGRKPSCFWSSRLRGKLADCGGLTLIEMLCATFILTLLCVMLSTGLAMAANHYRRLTAEAETELLLDTIASSLADDLRNSTLSVKEDAGIATYSHSLGKITIAGGSGDAGKTEPAQGTVVEDGLTEQKALLPDGIYGAVFGEDETDGKKRRYEVVFISVSGVMKKTNGDKVELPLDDWVTYPASGGAGLVLASDVVYPEPGEIVTYTLQLTVQDRVTGISKTTPEGGIVVRCLNPVKQAS